MSLLISAARSSNGDEILAFQAIYPTITEASQLACCALHVMISGEEGLGQTCPIYLIVCVDDTAVSVGVIKRTSRRRYGFHRQLVKLPLSVSAHPYKPVKVTTEAAEGLDGCRDEGVIYP